MSKLKERNFMMIEKKKKEKKVEYVTLLSGSNLLQHKKRKGIVVGSLEKSFNITQWDTIDKEAGRMFYISALPFNFAKSLYFRQYSKDTSKQQFGKL